MLQAHTGQFITQIPTADHAETTTDAANNPELDDAESTISKNSDDSKINLLLPNDPYAARIKTFCKSLKHLSVSMSYWFVGVWSTCSYEYIPMICLCWVQSTWNGSA